MSTLKRFRALCETMGVKKILAIATAACRDAKNGRAFIKLAERTIGAEIDVLSGGREAELTALGVISGVHRADGVVGDLGGGSLELVDVRGTRARHGVTRPLGGLALADISAKSVKKAEKFVKKTLSGLPMLKACEDRSFYAVGGTWRSLARLHMWQTGYPLHVMHGYAIPADEALEFARLVHRVDVDTLSNIEVVANARRPLLPYAALVLEYILRIGKPRQVVFSALGVREGLALFAAQAEGKGKGRADRSGARSQSAALALAAPRRRADRVDRPLHGLVRPRRDRARSAGCVTPRACWPISAGGRIPIIAASNRSTSSPTAAFPASIIRAAPIWRLRCFSAMSGWSMDDELSPRLRELASTRMLDRARVLGAALRLAYVVSAAMPGVLPETSLAVERHRLALRLAGRIRGARRRARAQPAALARAPHRPRAGDADGIDICVFAQCRAR